MKMVYWLTIIPPFRSFLMTLNDIKFEEYVEKPFHRISAQKQETIEVKPSVDASLPSQEST